MTDYPELNEAYPELQEHRESFPELSPENHSVDFKEIANDSFAAGMTGMPMARQMINKVTGGNPLKFASDKLIGEGVYDQIKGAGEKLSQIKEKYAGEPALEQGLDIQDAINQNMSGPDLANTNPDILKNYANAKQNVFGDLVPNIKTTWDSMVSYEKGQHGIVTKLAAPFSVPEQFVTREAVSALDALKLMPKENVKQMLSQEQLFPSDVTNYYWRKLPVVGDVDQNLFYRGARWLAGMTLNVAMDPLQAIQALAGLGKAQKQLQVFGETRDFSKVSSGEFMRAQVASNISKIIDSDSNLIEANKPHIENFIQGKKGFNDLVKDMDLSSLGKDSLIGPDTMREMINHEGDLLRSPPSTMQQVASGEQGLVMGWKVPFRNMSFEWYPYLPRMFQQYMIGKPAAYMAEALGKFDSFMGDQIGQYMGNRFQNFMNRLSGIEPGTSSGPLRLAMGAVNQFRTKTGFSAFDDTITQANGMRQMSTVEQSKLIQKGRELFSGAEPEHVANVANALELENKNPGEILQQHGKVDPFLQMGGAEGPVSTGAGEVFKMSPEMEMLAKANAKAKAIRGSFPENISDNLNEAIDHLRGVFNKTLKMNQEAGINVTVLNPFREGNDIARAYLPHVINPEFIRRNDLIWESIKAGQEVMKNKGAIVDASSLARQMPETIEKLNAVSKAAFDEPIFVENPFDLGVYALRNAYRNKIQRMVADSALDHSVIYSAADERRYFALESRMKDISKLAELGDEDALNEMRDILPEHAALHTKMGKHLNQDDLIKLDPEHFKELQMMVDENGQLMKDPKTGLYQTVRRNLSHLPDEFNNPNTRVLMPSRIYSRLLEEVNPFREGPMESIIDDVARINSTVKSVFVTSPRFWGLMGISKMLRGMFSNPVYPIKSLVTTIKQWEPPFSVMDSLAEHMKSPEEFSKYLVEKYEKPVFQFPDGSNLSRDEYHQEMIMQGVQKSGGLEKTPYGNVLDAVSGIRELNQSFGVVPRTVGEMATLWRTGRHVVDNIDDFFKTWWYTSRRYAGFSPAAAAEDTERIFYNFANTPQTGPLKRLSNAAMVFATHPVKELEYQLHTLLKGPIAQLSIPAKVQHTLEGAYIQDPQVRESLMAQMPLYRRMQDLALGPLAPGQMQLAMEIPWSNATMSLFFDPQKNLNPLFATMSTIASAFSHDKMEGDTNPQTVLKGIKDQVNNYWPLPVKEALQLAEEHGWLGDTQEFFGTGGLFGNIPNAPNSKGTGIRFQNQLEWGKWVQSQLGNGWLYKLLFKPMDPETNDTIDQQRMIERANIVQKNLGNLTGSLGMAIPMGSYSYIENKNLGDRAKELKKQLSVESGHLQDIEDHALNERWQKICEGTQELAPMDRTYLQNMGACNRQYIDLSESLKQQLQERGLMPNASELDNYHTLLEISKTNPLAAKMMEIKQHQQALHQFYSWWVDVNEEAQEKTGIPGFDPIKIILGLEKIQLSPEQNQDLQEIKQDMGSFLNRSQNYKNNLEENNRDTLQ